MGKSRERTVSELPTLFSLGIKESCLCLYVLLLLKNSEWVAPKLDSQYWHPPLKDQLRWLEGLSRTKISKLLSSVSSMDSTPFSYHWAVGCSGEETRKRKSKADRWALVLWKLLQHVRMENSQARDGYRESRCRVVRLPVADASPRLGTLHPFHIKRGSWKPQMICS